MQVIHVSRLRARILVPPNDPLTRTRAEGGTQRVLESALEMALERCGVGPHEEVCIRSLQVPMRLDFHQSDPRLVATLGQVLGEAISRAIALGRGVVRFSSPAHALVDMLLGVANNELSRAWAWQRLGLWSGSEAVSAPDAVAIATSILLSTPQSIVPAMRQLGQLGQLRPLARRISGNQWTAIAAAALGAYGLPTLLAPGLDEPQLLEVTSPGTDLIDLPIEDQARQIVLRSRIAAPMADAASSYLRAVFAILEAEPGLAHRGLGFVHVLLDAVARELQQPSVAQLPQVAKRPTPVASGNAQGRPGTLRVQPIEQPLLDRTSNPTLTEGLASEPDAERPLPTVQRMGQTRYAGLLCLVHLVEDLSLVDVLANSPELWQRSIRWSLHALARVLAPVVPTDPAALAFAGLAPDQEPPSANVAPATELELAVIERLATRMSTRLSELLDGADESPARLLTLVCRRAGEIRFDPGWIEVHLSLVDVDTAVRRAGLDLDPGWLPWLGAVVRFVYE